MGFVPLGSLLFTMVATSFQFLYFHYIGSYEEFFFLCVYYPGANNLIPIEIALKIANKIKAKERFSAYIVVPMWPEGNPTGAATQRILHWQVRSNYLKLHAVSQDMLVL